MAREPPSELLKGNLRRPGRGPLCDKIHGTYGHVHVVRVTRGDPGTNFEPGSILLFARAKRTGEEDHFYIDAKNHALRSFTTVRLGDCSTWDPEKETPNPAVKA